MHIIDFPLDQQYTCTGDLKCNQLWFQNTIILTRDDIVFPTLTEHTHQGFATWWKSYAFKQYTPLKMCRLQVKQMQAHTLI